MNSTPNQPYQCLLMNTHTGAIEQQLLTYLDTTVLRTPQFEDLPWTQFKTVSNLYFEVLHVPSVSPSEHLYFLHSYTHL